MLRICFVCLGNICRSPTAHGIMERMVEEAGLAARIAVDSAGTGAWHVGQPADARARATAEARGVALTSRARQFRGRDFGRFDYVLAMDLENRADLVAMAPDAAAQAKVYLLRAFEPGAPADAEVPDPYFGGDRGFDRVFDICEAACAGLLAHLRENHHIG